MYYLVKTKCGHVGRNKYIPIIFAVKADTAKEAAKIARSIPRVKHDHKDAILMVTKVTYEKFLEQSRINNSDPYLSIKSKREQKEIINLSLRLEDDDNLIKPIKTKNQSKEYKKKKEDLYLSFAEKEIRNYC